MKPLARTLTTLVCAVLVALTGLNAIADGISGSGIVRYFHSVVIDGVHYTTDNAIIRINGLQASEDDLKVGYHVSYRADGETREAWSMDYYDTVAGSVEGVQVIDEDMQVARITLMNQVVMTDADTWLHGIELDDIEPGMPLAVSAEWLPNGKLLASAVDAVSRLENIFSGQISSIQGGMLAIGGVSVDASNIGLTVNGVALVAGEWVHVIGHFDGGVLHANRLVRSTDRDVKPLPATMEGALRREGGQWHLRDMTLKLDEQAMARLLPGLRATVSGVLTPDGVLEATDVRVEEKKPYRLDGVIEAAQGNGESITVSGRRVFLDKRSSLRDDRDGYRWLGPENLSVFDAVSLIVEEVDGELRARKVTRTASLVGMVRARVSAVHWWRGPELLKKRQAAAYQARSARYNGKRIPAWRLRFMMKAGDELTLRFDLHGKVTSAEVLAGDED